ncbi:hypothetical protein TOPH_09081 [Tolypocladium ophioglossoides CBS 100239]|uniref:Uncharacterized protein n=1 Tax=Tolypocladium ophioglossoides (strain CBS 100239) TaxID=1163406 RepID=A0A0L0MXT5_TOLOC|nr:hypothetical protein TOPH_09081 [Tolypocladium ophioglossoides CBS 100239]
MELCRGSKPKYEQLPDTPLVGNPRKGKSPKRCWFLWCLLIAWNFILMAWGFYGLKAYFNMGKPSVVTTVSCNCGATLGEAVAMGCKYDPLSVSWLPPRCRDDELTAEFNQAGPGGEWPYWADRNMTQPLTIQQVGALAAKSIEDAQFWTTFGWHVSHCSFYWRKEHRMREKRMEVERRYDRESHIKHFHMMFMSRTALNETNTKAAVRLGGDRVWGVRTEAGKNISISAQNHH